jgi:hypothetical protein
LRKNATAFFYDVSLAHRAKYFLKPTSFFWRSPWIKHLLELPNNKREWLAERQAGGGSPNWP